MDLQHAQVSWFSENLWPATSIGTSRFSKRNAHKYEMEEHMTDYLHNIIFIRRTLCVQSVNEIYMIMAKDD